MRSHNAKKNKINFTFCLILLAIFVSSSECCWQNCTNSHKFGASYWQAWKRHTPPTDQSVSRFQLKRLSVTDWTVFIVFVTIKCPSKFRRPVMHFKSHSKSTNRRKETGNKKNCVLKASRKFDLHYQGFTAKTYPALILIKQQPFAYSCGRSLLSLSALYGVCIVVCVIYT